VLVTNSLQTQNPSHTAVDGASGIWSLDTERQVEIRATTADLQSITRTHLANERTFLAWMRTSISLFALGLAVALFYDGDKSLHGIESAMSAGLVAAGILTAGIGYRRYRIVQRRAQQNKDCGTVSRTVGIATGVILCSGVLIAAFVAELAA
jgi:putative membrane protein